MARTLQQIYNDLIAKKESNTELDTLLPKPASWPDLFNYENFKLLANSVLSGLYNSKVSIWQTTMYVVAYASWMQESLYDIFKSEVDTLTLNREFGQLPWYVNKAKEFQYGDSLQWIDNNYYGYLVVDEEKQIITQASATVSNGIIILKVAKGEIGSLEKLTTTELQAFTNYFMGSGTASANDGIAPAGTKMQIISDDADLLKMSINIYYDPLVLDNTGLLLEDGVTLPVAEAITNYIQGLPFNSKFRLIDLVTEIKAVSGVDNVVIKYCDAMYGVQAWTDIVALESQTYTSYAGYFEMNTNNGLAGYYDYPTNLIKTLNYIEKE
jgi:hypothetical protein